MYETENEFYAKNLKNFRQKFLEKELVIAGTEVLAVYDDVGTAYRETVKTHAPGSFTIKHVRKEPELVRLPTFFEGMHF
jgi:hypothetical protein